MSEKEKLKKAVEKVKITINGKEIWDEAGKPLLQVSIDAGIEVPHFCYHPGIGIEGSCRLCLVEIEGMPKLATSCTVPIKPDMVVHTQSDAVKKARKGVLEFFLLNHPLDCPFCDKGGECPLQNFTVDSGQFSSRFEFQKRHKAKHEIIGDHIVLDRERCVLCNRCVRFGRNLAGKEELIIRNRGARAEIHIPDGTKLSNAFTGNYADICPVGALTTREFRFRARPWEMKTENTVCGSCSLGCNVQAWRKKNELFRFTPRINADVNEWWLCDRGRFSLHQIPNEQRLSTVIHVGEGATVANSDVQFVDQVAGQIADSIKKVPERSLAFIADAAISNEEFFALKKLAETAGHGRVFAPISESALEVFRKIRGTELLADFPADFDDSNLTLVIGENVEEEHPVLALRFRRQIHSVSKSIKLVHTKSPGLADVVPASSRWILDPDRSRKVFDGLRDMASGRRPHSDNDSQNRFWEGLPALKNGQTVMVFLSENWITADNKSSVLEWLHEAQRNSEIRWKVQILWSAPNAYGMLDQWSDQVFPLSHLEPEIQKGKVEGLLWFGPAPDTSIFNEYARGMRIFVQAVLTKEEAHSAAKWLIPREMFYEKNGTMTNTFSKVQTLRRSKRVVQRGFEPIQFLVKLDNLLGGKSLGDENQMYAEVARSVTRYPKSRSEIPEATQTYAHYERALWQL